MRAPAEIDPLALAIHGDRLAARNGLDELRLVLLAPVAVEPDRFVAVPHLARDGLVAVDDLAHADFHAFQILGSEGLLAREVVVEPVLDGRPDGDLRLGPELLDRLGEHVGRVVAQQLQRLLGIPGHDGDGRIRLDGGGEVTHRAVDPDCERRPGESLADARGDVCPGHRSVEVPGRAVGQRDSRHVVSVLQMMRPSPMACGAWVRDSNRHWPWDRERRCGAGAVIPAPAGACAAHRSRRGRHTGGTRRHRPSRGPGMPTPFTLAFSPRLRTTPFHDRDGRDAAGCGHPAGDARGRLGA